MSDVVNHPPHYASGAIEVIEAIEDWKMNFHLGNAIKYIALAGKKDPVKEVEDLNKAIWYIRRQIELLESQKRGSQPVKPNDMNKRLPAPHCNECGAFHLKADSNLCPICLSKAEIMALTKS